MALKKCNIYTKICNVHIHIICKFRRFKKQTVKTMNYLRVASGSNKVEAGMDSAIMVTVQHALDLQLFLKECVKLGINVVHNRLPAKRGEYRKVINRSE